MSTRDITWYGPPANSILNGRAMLPEYELSVCESIANV